MGSAPQTVHDSYLIDREVQCSAGDVEHISWFQSDLHLNPQWDRRALAQVEVNIVGTGERDK